MNNIMDCLSFVNQGVKKLALIFIANYILNNFVICKTLHILAVSKH